MVNLVSFLKMGSDVIRKPNQPKIFYSALDVLKREQFFSLKQHQICSQVSQTFSILYFVKGHSRTTFTLPRYYISRGAVKVNVKIKDKTCFKVRI